MQMATLNEATRSADWLTLWGTTGGSYNCTTQTFDVGCVNCPDARPIKVAAFVRDQIFVTREFFYERDTRCVRRDQSLPSAIIWGGVWVLTLHKICLSLKFRCKIYEAIDRNSSIEDSPELRDLLDGLCDISMTSRLITRSRTAAGNFSVISSPITSQFSLLIHKRHLLSGQISPGYMILNSFTPGTWLVLMAAVIVLSGGLTLSEKLRHVINHTEHTWMELAYGALVGQIVQDFPEQILSLSHTLSSTVCFVTVSLLFGVIATNTFYAMLPYALTAARPMKAPFTTVEEFLGTEFKLYGTSSVKETMLQSKQQDIYRLGQRVTVWSNFNSRQIYEFMARNTGKKEAFLVRKEDETLLANYSCDFVEAVPAVQQAVASAYWFRQSDRKIYSGFTSRFAKSIQVGKLQADINYYTIMHVRSMIRRMNHQPEACLPHPLPTTVTIRKRALNMSDLRLPFIALSVITVWGILITAFEKLYQTERTT